MTNDQEYAKVKKGVWILPSWYGDIKSVEKYDPLKTYFLYGNNRGNQAFANDKAKKKE